MKTTFLSLLCVGFLAAGCSSESLTSSQLYTAVNQTASSKKMTRKRNDPPVHLDLRQAEILLNEYRNRYKLEPLSHHPQLQDAAARHAAELARYSRVSHTGRNGSNPAQRVSDTGYIWLTVGENVSAGRNSIPEVIKAWHNSPLHRKNLQLQGAVHFGLAVKHNPKSKLSNYWVLVVGAPKPMTGGSVRIGIGG